MTRTAVASDDAPEPKPSAPITFGTTFTNAGHNFQVTPDGSFKELISNRIENPTLQTKAPDQLLAALGNTWQILVKLVGSLEGVADHLRGTGASQPIPIMPAGVIGVARENKDLAAQALEIVGTIEGLIGDFEEQPIQSVTAVQTSRGTYLAVERGFNPVVDHAAHDCSAHGTAIEANARVTAQSLVWGDILIDFGGAMVVETSGVDDIEEVIVHTNAQRLVFNEDEMINVYRAKDHDAGLLDMEEVRAATVAKGSVDVTALMRSFQNNIAGPGAEYTPEEMEAMRTRRDKIDQMKAEEEPIISERITGSLDRGHSLMRAGQIPMGWTLHYSFPSVIVNDKHLWGKTLALLDSGGKPVWAGFEDDELEVSPPIGDAGIAEGLDDSVTHR